MRNYFLLEAGDTMYDFYTAIFDKVQEKESWQQLSFLNVQLQEAVGQRYPEDSSRYCMYLCVKTDTDYLKNNVTEQCLLILLHYLFSFIFISYFVRLSIFLETIDPARKKHPVNNLEVLTLSYKVNNENVFV